MALGLVGRGDRHRVGSIGSAAFALYAANLGSYDETYGSLGGVVVLLLWLYITVFVVVLGAEINAALETQTVRDSTTGPDAPLGQRGPRQRTASRRRRAPARAGSRRRRR